MTSLTVSRAKMAADPNMNFHMGMLPSSLHSSHVVSFQSGAVTSSNMMFPMDSSGGMSGLSGMALAGSPSGVSNSSGMVQAGTSSGALLLDQVPGLKADTGGLAADWSYDEQLLLEAGLCKYSDEPNMMKYIKIAATLRDKTVRDVALRCQWMTKKENGKRRKPAEYYMGKKVKDRKDKMVESSLVADMLPSQPVTSYSFAMPHVDQANPFSCEVPVIDGTTKCRIEENSLLFCKIEDNLNTLKPQDNINLLCHTKNNLTSILNSIREIPGMMSQMPPLPVSINMELAEKILPSMSQQLMFGVSGGNS